jgi:hypothetical protein
MANIKVLTVQFDVTHLDKAAVDSLMCAVISQGEEISVYAPDAEFCTRYEQAEVLNTSVKVIDSENGNVSN